MCERQLTTMRAMFTRDKAKILTLLLQRPVCSAFFHPLAALRFWL